MRLAKLALVDYREERYHACIPVVLALLDGMVNELGNLGFFSKDVDLTAWDSMAASDSGLNELQQLLFKQRAKTRTEAIDVPYRNGIHHGMDLGYDTRIVAAKCWVALFAAADWAHKIERGERDAPPPEPEPTLWDALAKVRRNQEERTLLEAWIPRANIDLAKPTEGSPEAALSEFLEAWKSRNYGAMAKRLGVRDDRPMNMRAGEVRSQYEDLVLNEFTIQTVRDTAASVSKGRSTRCRHSVRPGFRWCRNVLFWPSWMKSSSPLYKERRAEIGSSRTGLRGSTWQGEDHYKVLI